MATRNNTRLLELYDAVDSNVSRSKAIARLLTNGDDGEESAELNAAYQLFEMLNRAERDLSELWETLKADYSRAQNGGGSRPPEDKPLPEIVQEASDLLHAASNLCEIGMQKYCLRDDDGTYPGTLFETIKRECERADNLVISIRC